MSYVYGRTLQKNYRELESTARDLSEARSIQQKIKKPELKKIVIFGASILNNSFGDAAVAGTVQAALIRNGFQSVEIIDYAEGGHKKDAYLAKIDDALLSVAGETGVTFLIHGFGGDVSDLRPFSSNTDQERYDFANAMVQILEKIKLAGHDIILTNITYRDYKTNFNGEEDGSKPYNTAIIEPLIKTYCPNSWDFEKDEPYFNFYKVFFENPEFLGTDGIHHTTDGELYLIDYFFKKLGNMYRTNKYSSSNFEVIVDVGGNTLNIQDHLLINEFSDFEGVSTKKVIDRNGVPVLFIESFKPFAGLGSGGKGNTGDSTYSLDNHLMLTDYFFTDSSAIIRFSGFKENTTGVISVVGSRDTQTGVRKGLFTIGGISKILDAEINEIINIPFTSDSNGEVFMKAEPSSGSTTAYLSGIQILCD